ncbi:MAG TPA: aldolase/citrate lyase family protein [Bacilli bacterium]
MILSLKEKARQRELAYGTFIFEFFEAGVPMMVKQAGGEFVVLDMEHSGAGLDRLRPIILLCRAVGIVPIVRVQDSQYHHIAGALDCGAQGIMIPMVETAEQMKSIIQHSKYYPKGARGNAFGFAHDDYISGPVPAKMAGLNDRVMLIPLIESKLGAENAREIAAIDEVDLLWIGHLDLSSSLGVPGDFEHPDFKNALGQIFKAGDQNRKSCGILIPDAAAMGGWYNQGVRFFSYSADVFLFQNTLKQGITKMKEMAESF